MKNRPGGQARSTRLRTYIATGRSNCGVWLGFLVLTFVVSGLMLMAPFSLMVQSFLLGFLDAVALACFAGFVIVLAGSRGRGAGRGAGRSKERIREQSKEKLGEEATAKVVASGRRRRSGWKLVNAIALAGHGHIDHVLVGPDGIFVIESRWASTRCSVEGSTVKGLTGPEPISQATEAALALEGWLRQVLFGMDVEVRPVVVIWGPGRIKFKEGWGQIDGVLVCDGTMDQRWLEQLDASRLDQSTIDEIATVLTSQTSLQIRTSLASEIPFVLSARA